MASRDVKVVRHNINSIINKTMHRPISKDGYILYGKRPDYRSDNNFEGDKTADTSPLYQEAVKSNYNSPTNIRKLFITGRGVGVQHYSTMILAKANQAVRYKFYPYEDGLNLFNIAAEQLTLNENVAMLQIEKAINNKVNKTLNNNIIDGNFLGAVANPYTCNNVEEIYLDWTFLLSTDDRIRNYFKPDFNTIANFLTDNSVRSISKSDALKQLFIDTCSGGVKDLRKRFPRLRVIAMIANLYNILQDPSLNIVDRDFTDVKAPIWLKANEQLVKKYPGQILIANLESDLTFPNSEFIIKDYMYRFDNDKLKTVIDKYKDRIKQYKDSLNGVNIDKEASELELILLSIEEDAKKAGKDPNKEVLEIISFAMNSHKVSELREELKKMTRENAERYAKITGIELK